jgi:hypothetical protein
MRWNELEWVKIVHYPALIVWSDHAVKLTGSELVSKTVVDYARP